MPSIGTYEYVLSQLATLKYGLYDAEAAIRSYQAGLAEAIEGPVTSFLEDEAAGWIAKLDSAQWAVDVYWEGYVAGQIADLEAAAAEAAVAAEDGATTPTGDPAQPPVGIQ